MNKYFNPHWSDLNSNLAYLGYYLVETYGLTGEEVLYMVEKPWKYEEEWKEYRKSLEEEE